MACQEKIAIACIVFLSLNSIIANQMDPHVFPKEGPFFEGWYIRIIDSHQNVSFAIMFGRVLPPATVDTRSKFQSSELLPIFTDKGVICEKNVLKYLPESKYTIGDPHPVFVGLLLALNQHTKPINPSGYFSPTEFNITVDGKPVVENPNDKSPPHFELQVANNFSFFITANESRFSVILGNYILKGEIMTPVPWGPNGEGPEGWLSNLPLPFHWFVYSLKSTVKWYTLINKETGRIVKSSDNDVPVVAHMEKNWGNSFPKAWIWSQGIDPQSGVSFVFSAGLVTFLVLDVKAQLAGYRNLQKNISCNFNPANSVHELQFDACSGTAMLKVESLTCAVTFQISAPIDSFSSCLDAPMAIGFVKGCVQSFAAVANITVYQRSFFSMVLTDSQIVRLSVLEFGQAYMCNGQCPVQY